MNSINFVVLYWQVNWSDDADIDYIEIFLKIFTSLQFHSKIQLANDPGLLKQMRIVVVKKNQIFDAIYPDFNLECITMNAFVCGLVCGHSVILYLLYYR